MADFAFPVTLSALILLVLGALNCFMGYRLFHVLLALWGFVLGVVLAASVASAANIGTFGVLLSAVVGGLVGAGLFMLMYIAGVFLAGAAIGYTLATGIMMVLHMDGSMLISLTMALLFGLLALAINKFIIIFSTAFAGAWAMVEAFIMMLGAVEVGRRALINSLFGLTGTVASVALVVWIVLAILGMVVQYRTTAEEEHDIRPVRAI